MRPRSPSASRLGSSDRVDELPLGLNGPPIDFSAYHFDPHTLPAVVLLSIAIAVLLVTAIDPERKSEKAAVSAGSSPGFA
jgi:hypothetical protein